VAGVRFMYIVTPMTAQTIRASVRGLMCIIFDMFRYSVAVLVLGNPHERDRGNRIR